MHSQPHLKCISLSHIVSSSGHYLHNSVIHTRVPGRRHRLAGDHPDHPLHFLSSIGSARTHHTSKRDWVAEDWCSKRCLKGTEEGSYRLC